MQRAYQTTAYRYPGEQLILALTLLLVFLVIALTATATLCTSALFVLAMVGFAYASNSVRHDELVKRAQRVTPQTAPGLAALVQECAARLQAEPVQVFVAPGNALNAYTFGLAAPKVVVLYSPLLPVMDEAEMRFIIGHELGHVRLGHTWLNSLVGGMAGIPSPYAALAILRLAFLWWNRACEYSADRAGLLACGKPQKAMTALVKLTTRTSGRTSADMARALQRVEAEDDDIASYLTEALATHPMTIRRIEALRRYAASAEYRRLQILLDGNVKREA
ncbi:MAG: M48 family metallopeptidase [Chloroflexi bacterium]|nr:M48 family metallopeptidase [Chloroflexota bacterium]